MIRKTEIKKNDLENFYIKAFTFVLKTAKQEYEENSTNLMQKTLLFP